MKKLTWQDSVNFCNTLDFGNKSDWRLPSLTELESLIDLSQLSPSLPEGHPFINVQISSYWASNSFASFAFDAWYFDFDKTYYNVGNKGSHRHVWPVRVGNFNKHNELIISELQIGQARFIDNLDGTITDNKTGLVWIEDLDSIYAIN